jgi:hypothetical protein
MASNHQNVSNTQTGKTRQTDLPIATTNRAPTFLKQCKISIGGQQGFTERCRCGNIVPGSRANRTLLPVAPTGVAMPPRTVGFGNRDRFELNGKIGLHRAAR